MTGNAGGSGRLTDLIAVGALTSLIPRQVLDAAIATHGCRERRARKLPAHVVVYLLIALCLFPDDDYEEVTEKLTSMLALVPGSRWEASVRGAITQAPQRLETEAVKEVFQQIARPAATESPPGAWLNRRQVMAIDGFVVDLPDTEANVPEFGRDSAGGYETAFPRARIVAISECASHAIVAADVAGFWAGEQTLAFSLYQQLTEEMLLTADHGFYSFPAWRQARHSGAHLLWRVQAGPRPYWLHDLEDGSWLAVIT